MPRMMAPNTTVWFVPAAGMSTLGSGNGVAKAADINTNGTNITAAINSKGYKAAFKTSVLDKTHSISDTGNIDTPTLADYEAKFELFKDSIGTSGTAAPAITLGTTNSTGGTFAAGTYYWVVTATSATGESITSNEVTATLAVNGTQVLNWTAVTGATGYNIYRGTVSGGENVLVASVGAVVTYTDTGAAGSAGSPKFNITVFTKAYNVFSGGQVTGYLIVRQGYPQSTAAAAGHICNIFKVTSDYVRNMEGKPGEPITTELEFFPQGESYANQSIAA